MSFLGIGGTSVTTTYGPEITGPAAAAAAAKANAAAVGNTSAQGIGTTYMYNDPATVQAATINKIKVLSRTDPVVAQYAQTFFGVDAGLPKNNNSQPQSLDKNSRNLFQTTFSQELKLAKKNINQVNPSSDNTSGQNPVAKNILDVFKPISQHVGSTLGNQNGVQNAPFLSTPTFLPAGLNYLVNKVSVGFGATMDAVFKKHKLDTTQHAPSQVQGSPSSVAVASKSNVSYPLGLVPDIYNGVQTIIQNKSAIIGEAEKAGVAFATGVVGGLLDGLTSQVTSPLLKAAAKGTVQNLTAASSQYLGTKLKTQLTNSVKNQSSQLGTALQNPLTIATHYLPKIPKGIAAFNAPLSIAGNYLPSALASAFGNPTSTNLPGFGNSGNLGFALQPALQAVQGLVVQSALSNFKGQEAILGPLLTLGAEVLTTSLSPLSTTPPAKKQSSVNPGIVATQGVPQPQTTPNPVLPLKTETPASSKSLIISSPISNGLPQPIDPSQEAIEPVI